MSFAAVPEGGLCPGGSGHHRSLPRRPRTLKASAQRRDHGGDDARVGCSASTPAKPGYV
jgi:hypothetical protein